MYRVRAETPGTVSIYTVQDHAMIDILQWMSTMNGLGDVETVHFSSAVKGSISARQ